MKLPRTGVPQRHMTTSTPALEKGTTEFDEFRFSFSSTPPTLSQNSSRHSSRPPLPPSTPGVDEPLPAAESGTSSPGLALYRPPEDITSVRGYFDRSNKASSSRAEQTREQELEATLDPGEKHQAEVEELVERHRSMISEQVDAVLPDQLANHGHEAGWREAIVELADAEQAMARLDPIPAPGPPEEEDDAEDDPQDVEPMGDDDMDGALEGMFWFSNIAIFLNVSGFTAIGMRGPITSVFQNVFLMIFIIDLAIAVGIWVPFTMGKTTALLFVSTIWASSLLLIFT